MEYSVGDQEVHPFYSAGWVWFFIADILCPFSSFGGILLVVQVI
jgi:hypothetical protein